MKEVKKRKAHLPEFKEKVGLEALPLYNGARPHQALGYQTPDVVYRSGSGGGAAPSSCY